MEGEGYNDGRRPCSVCCTMTCRAGGCQTAADSADMDLLQDQLAQYRADLKSGLLTPEERAETKRRIEVVEDHKRWMVAIKGPGDVWACVLCGMRGEYGHLVHHVDSDPPCARRLRARAVALVLAEPGAPRANPWAMHPCE